MATITVTELATELDTDARTARKFLRSITPADEQPGKGSRWAIEKKEIRSMKSKFSKFTSAADEASQKREVAKKAKAEEPTDEPTEADLEAIDMEDLI